MTKAEYVLVAHRERLEMARLCLSHVWPTDIVEGEKLYEIRKQIAELRQEHDRKIGENT